MEHSEIQPVIDDTFQKIHDIESMLQKNDPMISGHLKAIHQNLIKYEELCHLLSDEQIHQLIKGQSQVTGTVIVKDVAKSSKSTNTRMAKGIRADDL